MEQNIKGKASREEPVEHHQEAAKKSVLLNAGKMALGTFSSRILGLVRDSAFGAIFPRSVTDAWTAAFRLPNLFRRLLGEGSLSVSFIPVFVEAKIEDENKGSHEAANLVNGFYTSLLMTLTILTAFGILFAEPILKVLLDQSYVNNAEQFLLTVRMAKIMFGFIFLMSHFAFFMGILNALGEFSLPAVAPVFFNISMIISTFIPQSWFSVSSDGIAWGVIVGGIWQAGVLIPALKKRGYFPKISLHWSHPKVKRVYKSMLPGLIGTGILQITTLINLRFASSLGEGAISYIYFADRLLELPLSLVAVSLGTALLPTLSQMWSAGHREKFLQTTQHYLRMNLFVCLPASAGLLALSQPIVEVLFNRGRFSTADVTSTALVSSIYSLILISSSSVRVLVPLYYAMKNTWWPSTVGALSLVSHILIAPYLMSQWGLGGLTFSTFVSSLINFIGLAVPISSWVGSLGWRSLAQSFFKSLLASSLMGVLVFFINQTLRVYLGTGEVGRTLNLIVTILIGFVFFVIVSHLFKSNEMVEISHLVKNKLKKRFKL